MDFADLAIDDFLCIANGDLGEGIEYQANLSTGAQPWKAIRAVVERGDPSVPLDISSMSRRGPDPIQATISRDPTHGIVEISPKVDLLKLNPGTDEERIYQVVAIFDLGDPAAWRLYAVA